MNNQELADKVFIALTIWREARGETEEAQIGVAHVIMNRVKKPSWWGNDPMSVVFKKWQFSSITDPQDRQLTKWPESTDKSWIQCLDVACDVVDGKTENPVANADSYHDISILPPKWATQESFVCQIDRILFYDVP